MLKILKSKKGQGMTEYILIVALIAILAVGGVKIFGSRIKGLFTGAAEKVSSEASEGGIKVKSSDSKDFNI